MNANTSQPSATPKNARPAPRWFDFATLYRKEAQVLDAGRATCPSTPAACRVSAPGPAAEPWVAFCERDRVGLALSGGGIRSATFNLGLLNGLRHKRVLTHVDYLTTVSGGGYIGGWWKAWRARPGATADIFPRPVPETSDGSADGPEEIREPAEVRHLREFSRFLMPRVGPFRFETWSAVVTVLGGTVMSLLLAASLVVLLVYVWLAVACPLAHVAHRGALPLALALQVALLFGLEWKYRRDGLAEPDRYDWLWYGLFALTAVYCVGLFWPFTVELLQLAKVHSEWAPAAFRQTIGVQGEYGFNAFLFLTPLVLLATAVVLMVLRLLAWRAVTVLFMVVRRWERPHELLASEVKHLLSASKTLLQGGGPGLAAANHVRVEANRRRIDSGLHRVLTRVVAVACCWALLAGLWELAVWMGAFRWQPGGDATWSLVGPGGTVITAGALFTWLRQWLVGGKAEPNGGALRAVLRKLKPMVPQALATLTVAALLLLAMTVVAQFGLATFKAVGLGLAVPGLVFVLGVLLFDPARTGLHDFYRARIARAYLGASNPQSYTTPPTTAGARRMEAARNRQTEERPEDDLPLRELAERPVHLICCAANDLAGDRLPTLNRGAASAVLSCHGIAVGNYAAPLEHLRLSDALTASAAAFNPNMGSKSVGLGWPVTFLLAALNLRLGLWVRHPLSRFGEEYWFPGFLFIKELFMRTRCAVRPRPGTPTCVDDDVHLSDGGHFENLALYELVRRHCRYLIVSDSGQDPQGRFDDLGNAVRRVREDFGVEIEIDVAPLRSGPERQARQHVVVGTIHYDGVVGSDKGMLLYFKPVLTGDEPADVLEYQHRSPEFPHESTGDQFYDEAQWEAYRRLGEHSVHAGLRFVDRLDRRPGIEQLFRGAREAWYPTPPEFQGRFLELTDRCVRLEAEIRDQAPDRLRAEFFPDVIRAVTGHSPTAPAAPPPAEELRIVSFVLTLLQLMEDVWLGCQLDTHWSHPLNRGWVNYLQRWSRTASVRRWWPVLGPLYNPEFRRFAEERLALASTADRSRSGNLTVVNEAPPQFFANDPPSWFSKSDRRAALMRDPACRIYALHLQWPGVGLHSLLLAALPVVQTDGAASWDAEELAIAPGFWDAGLGTIFVRGILAQLEAARITVCRVTLAQRGAAAGFRRRRTDIGFRQQRTDTITFYKTQGFDLTAPDRPDQPVILQRRTRIPNHSAIVNRGGSAYAPPAT